MQKFLDWGSNEKILDWKILVLACLLASLLVATNVDADMAPRQPEYIDVQGAKVVSEGAYFYFNITSKNDDPIHDLHVRIWKHSRFVWVDYEEYLWLENNESRTFHLIAPRDIADWYEEFTITINSMVGGFKTDAPMDTVYFRVVVVDYSILRRLQKLEDRTYDDLLKEIDDLKGQLGNLLSELRLKPSSDIDLIKSLHREIILCKVTITVILVCLAGLVAYLGYDDWRRKQ